MKNKNKFNYLQQFEKRKLKVNKSQCENTLRFKINNKIKLLTRYIS